MSLRAVIDDEIVSLRAADRVADVCRAHANVTHITLGGAPIPFTLVAQAALGVGIAVISASFDALPPLARRLLMKQ